MTPERWEQIGQVYEQARELALSERVTFLDRACAGDEELRREVESLLAAEATIGDFIAAPALKDAAEMVTAETPGTLVGKQLGHYQILSFIGAGGMGEVYSAHDPRLSRKVAIKLLLSGVAQDADRLRRFAQEARAVGMLNHPNILTVHDVGTHQGAPYIVSELLEGETLRDRLKNGPFPPSRAVEIGLQLTRGLAAAHERGIVHRDLKPENLFITADERVKILDFGLAKLTQPRLEGSDPESAIIQSHPGLVMGTVGYMAPEQLRGEEADHRADIFAFGVILYEMLAGERPFRADSAAETISAILKQETPELPASIRAQSHELERVIRRCLEKKPERRFQSASDLGFALEGLTSSSQNLSGSRRNAGQKVEGEPTIPIHLNRSRPKRSRMGLIGWAGWALAAIFMVATIGLTIAYLNRPGSFTRIVPFTSFPGQKSNPVFSPDGNQIAFFWDGGEAAESGIYVKLIDAGMPLRIASLPAASAPNGLPLAWSPDGRQIAFARRGAEGGIFMVPALGGPERKLTDVTGDFAWSPDGKTLAIAGSNAPQQPSGISLLSLETGEWRRLTAPEVGVYGDRSPAFSPDGKVLAFIRSPSFLVDDIYLVHVSGGNPIRLTTDNLQLQEGLTWTANGKEIVYSSPRGGLPSLWRIPFFGGNPKRVIGIGEYAYSPSISRQGQKLAYVYRRVDRNIWRAPGPSSNSQGSAPVKLIASTREEVSPHYSPDGKQIAFVSDRSGSREIWVCAGEGQDAVQLTNFGGSHTGTPRWSPDGRQITFDSRPEGQSDIYLIGPEGGRPRRFTTEISDDVLPDWSRDGRWIYFGSNRGGDWQIWKAPAEGGPAVQVTRHGGYQVRESVDGKYIYYSKREAGIWMMPAEGGEESLVIDRLRYGYWDLWERGICFLSVGVSSTGVSVAPTIELLNLATRQTTTLVRLEKGRPPFGATNLTVSPDGQWILYWQADQVDNDIMLVENFR